jgi:hypothetical protein
MEAGEEIAERNRLTAPDSYILRHGEARIDLAGNVLYISKVLSYQRVVVYLSFRMSEPDQLSPRREAGPIRNTSVEWRALGEFLHGHPTQRTDAGIP